MSEWYDSPHARFFPISALSCLFIVGNYSPAFACLIIIIFEDFICLFSERGEGSEKQRERNIGVKEKCYSVASPTRPNWGPKATQARDLTRNGTGYLCLRGTRPNQPGQGAFASFLLGACALQGHILMLFCIRIAPCQV